MGKMIRYFSDTLKFFACFSAFLASSLKQVVQFDFIRKNLDQSPRFSLFQVILNVAVE